MAARKSGEPGILGVARSLRGSTLVWVLMLLLLFSILGTTLLHTTLLEQQMKNYNHAALQGELAADAGVETALVYIREQMDTTWSREEQMPAQLTMPGNPVFISSAPPQVRALITAINITGQGYPDDGGHETIYACSFTAAGLYHEAEIKVDVVVTCGFTNHYLSGDETRLWHSRTLDYMKREQYIQGYN